MFYQEWEQICFPSRLTFDRYRFFFVTKRPYTGTSTTIVWDGPRPPSFLPIYVPRNFIGVRCQPVRIRRDSNPPFSCHSSTSPMEFMVALNSPTRMSMCTNRYTVYGSFTFHDTPTIIIVCKCKGENLKFFY